MFWILTIESTQFPFLLKYFTLKNHKSILGILTQKLAAHTSGFIVIKKSLHLQMPFIFGALVI